jgi:hypothetical protein
MERQIRLIEPEMPLFDGKGGDSREAAVSIEVEHEVIPGAARLPMAPGCD